ncbi:hypothetical protein TVAG_484000 [Trichomonas vaginalis G3]|uniref:Uncharacterized protein n=1 Tax=Trichomonas vaginalis (strain ATCC PRA-98 / G3) TaxID=412133 RepID=A2EA43_TRIV3|nr:hypothetical protein TVAGG3_0980840 [Trichomonas vaginalis G3]EAY10489.1 hypothetical protein TVAG_484000 [Trichomonas vaginalis G3]KAI5489283.1 hypothetical protein TVAGG3_0980840 [Trichomonas vaginalis G3]|eukprot:XP_001322712.1 hypothetical protein [Trichomonas vaginalis G3]
MEEEISIAIKQKSISSLENKLQLLRTALNGINARNTELQSMPPLQRLDLTLNQPNILNNTHLIEENFRANTRYQKAKQQLSNMQKANEQLDIRIQKAQQLLNQERGEAKLRNVALLSPTAAKLLSKNGDLNKIPQQNQMVRQAIEVTHLTEQINAIEQLKNGAQPKPLGVLSINFDQLIQQENSKLQRLIAEKDEASNKFVRSIEFYLEKSNKFEDAQQSHAMYAQSFKKFQKSYNTATDNIESLPFHALLNILKNESTKSTVNNLNDVIDSLHKECKVIEYRLEKMGVDDQESSELKHKIKVQLLYLSHITAIAEKALCKMSARKPPLDPLETLQIDISEMEQLVVDK